jgi:hypothetical protein
VVASVQNLAQFEKQLDDVVKEKVEKRVVDISRFIISVTYNNVIQNASEVSGYGSPVLRGNFRRNHKIAINYVDQSFSYNLSATEERPLGPLKANKEVAKLASLQIGDTVFISNSLPYARRLESEGWSTKTPQGIYKVSVASAVNYFSSFDFSKLSKSFKV